MPELAPPMPFASPHDAGVRYVCTHCGTCCRWPGIVRVEEDEVHELAEHLGLPLQTFLDRYTAITPDRRGLTLIERPDESCIFLTAENRCEVHAVKPRQCRRFPNDWNFPRWQEECQAMPVRVCES